MNRIAVVLLAVAVLLLAATSAKAQTADSQAYFQWMNAVTADSRPEALVGYLNAAGVSEHERDQVAAILAKFKADEFGLEASYNNLPSVQKGRNDDTDLFFTKQDQLVQRTITKLLTLKSFKSLDARVAHEAKNLTTVNLIHHDHSMLQNVSMGPEPQGIMGMNPAYSLYQTMGMGLPGAGVTAAMLTNPNNGGISFPQWNAANLVDANTSDVGFATDGVPGGGETGVWVDFGANPQDIIEWPIFMSAAGYSGHFAIYYSDGNGYPNVVPDFTPTDQGWNYAAWPDAGAHRFWIMNLTVAGTGATINEMQLIKSGLEAFVTFSITGTTHCPNGCSGALHNGYVTNSMSSPVTGPQISATGFMNVVNPGSQWLPAGGPPVEVDSDNNEVDCTVVQGPIQKPPFIHNDIEEAITYSNDLGINCHSTDPQRPFCREIIDYCLPTSVPPDFDPTEVISSHSWIDLVKYWNQLSFCDRPPNSPPGTSWTCIWPMPNGFVLPRADAFRKPCTNYDKRTSGVWP